MAIFYGVEFTLCSSSDVLDLDAVKRATKDASREHLIWKAICHSHIERTTLSG